MAHYKDKTYVRLTTLITGDKYDKIHTGGGAPWAGIYRCQECGHEIGIAKDHELPPCEASDCESKKWKLLVSATHKK